MTLEKWLRSCRFHDPVNHIDLMFPANFASDWRCVKEALEVLVAEMLEENVRLDKALEEFEKQFLQTALRRSGGNQCKAAELLHIHRNTLARKIIQYKIKAKR